MENSNHFSWSKALHDLRSARGLTQARAAELTGVALRTWISWENNHRHPSGPALTLLRRTFPDAEFPA